MEYMMFVLHDPAAEPYAPEDDDLQAWGDEVERRGVWIAGDRLRPPEDAKTVRVRGDKAFVTDGPFTESKEWIAGFDVIEVRDLDEAIEIAAKHPMARFGRIELRRAWPLSEGFEP
ncbi:YciI family protein [Agromyces sp. CF514]|uniref:YciI family protein n=1 Tax=Agromyces sp. CF514 TaxID=1881031 RepID=UPI000B8712CC|nr:YciI family protein [Agromyces sp. CF514]